jgi:5'-deoxynucleotidase
MLDRMQYINRWGLMRNNRTERSERAQYGCGGRRHALAIIRNRICLNGRNKVDPSYLMGAALLHDASEIITGDLPTPINISIRKLHRLIRTSREKQMTSSFPAAGRNAA